MEQRIYGLLGRKLGHSWSVPIHQELGIPNYQLFELEPEDLEAFVRRADIGGLSVTMPYKRTVMSFCDEIAPQAQAVGSVNALTLRQGRLCGWNTDVYGFIYMAQLANIDFSGKKVVLLGSGGASLAVRAAAEELHAGSLIVISRTGPNCYENLDRHADAQIIVNATPVGMYPDTGKSPVDLRQFPHCEGVLDCIYNPRRTALLLQAEALGIPNMDGLPMLVAQAKAAEELFQETVLPDSEILRILGKLRQATQNIVLIGMPGSGKNTVGAALGALTGREIVDIDAEIIKLDGRSIPEIFSVDGEAAFRLLERRKTIDAGRLSGKILLTGGGVVKDARNYAYLHQNGRIYQLLRSPELLETDGRPLSQGVDLDALYREREPLYARFRDVTIDNNRTPEEAAAEIWREFCEHSGD